MKETIFSSLEGMFANCLVNESGLGGMLLRCTLCINSVHRTGTEQRNSELRESRIKLFTCPYSVTRTLELAGHPISMYILAGTIVQQEV